MIDMNLGDTQLLVRECTRQALSLEQCAYVLATAKWETAHTMKPVREAMAGTDDEAISRLESAWRRGKLPWVSKPYWRRDGDGKAWFGRGYVQLTHKHNYERARTELGVDVVADPSLALKPEVAAQIIVSGMTGGWFGRRLGDYINADKVDYMGARRSVNNTDRQHEIARIAREYEEALREADYDKPADHEIAKPDLGPGSGWAKFLEWLVGWLAGKGKQ